MSDLCEFSATRRGILGTAGALFAWGMIPRAAAAPAGRDPRFVTIVLRGAMDGLSAVPPVGDPAYAALRGAIALEAGRSGDNRSGLALPLEGFFALHPAMPNLARLYRAGQASIVHAVATGYRDRSHFDGQDVLESGWPRPGQTRDGWLNRAALAIPFRDRINARTKAAALAVGAVPPLIVRGVAPVYGWSPPMPVRATADTVERLLGIYAASDPPLAERLRRTMETDRLAQGGKGQRTGRSGSAAHMRAVAEGAARIIAADDGPRLAALAFDGWDTHANEGGATGRLAELLTGLDDALQAFETTLGERWRQTVLMVITEFGRTVHVNGTVGTDHGTGTVAFLVGGAVKGGRVIADWPGLKEAALLEGRDLKPTVDLRGVAKGVLGDLFEVPQAALQQSIFPGTEAIRPLRDLVV
jgi:uncharacterized protein (DUF1501 family)